MNHKISLRPAEEKDCKLLWEWRNEKNAREASFDSDPIFYKEHKAWFDKKIRSKNTKILIIENNHKKEIGQVRFDINYQGVAKVSIIIDKDKRGRGYGAKVLKLSCEYAFKSFPIKEMIAYIKWENAPSLRIFKKSGFTIKRAKKIKGCSCYEMSLERNNQKQD